MDRKTHWEDVYERKASTEVSWFQPRPQTSLELFDRAGISAAARVIDVGGGASRLVDHLIDRGFEHVTVLDISARALELTRRRLGERAGRVTWVEADITEAELPGPYDLWHDRAVFHFLVDAADREAYATRLERALAPGGHVVVATFAEDGPERCSGLPVVRYAPEALRQALSGSLELVETRREMHRTPAGKQQSFVYCLFRRT